jgi:hypothetical protein
MRAGRIDALCVPYFEAQYWHPCATFISRALGAESGIKPGTVLKMQEKSGRFIKKAIQYYRDVWIVFSETRGQLSLL